MPYVRRASFALLAALALGGGAAAAPPNELAAAQNYTQASRKPNRIRFIVVHVAEGSFLGTVSWLRDPGADASVNFVVSRTGRVQKLVPLRDVAWHAGNWAYNLRSIGIENEGYVADPAGFPPAEYKAAATIAGRVARQSLIPIDRRHIIGHSEVPNPTDPLQGGGIDGHRDPGPYWNWSLFMKLVRAAAFPQRAVAHRRVGLQVQSSTLYGGQVIAGRVPWRAKIGGPVTKVAFLVDRRVRWVDHVRPFAFAGGRMWSTFGLKNGKHLLELRAYGAKGSWTRQRFTLRVRNEPFTLATVGLKPQQRVTGVLPVQSLFTGVPPARVRLLLDGREIDHDTSAPYVFTWDTRRTKDGRHSLTLVAKARDGRVVRASTSVVVANAVAAAPQIAASSLVDGQTLSGVQRWLVETGGSVARVEFLVDATVRSTAAAAPYAWDWDTTQEAPGTHALVVRAIGADGTSAEKSVSVTVVR